MDEFVIGNDDVSPNMTTLAPEVTTEYIPIYYPECLANYTGECDSCLKDAFFWTREQNESTSHNNFGMLYVSVTTIFIRTTSVDNNYSV